MKTYIVRLEVVKIYDVEVQADGKDEAIETAIQTTTDVIEAGGTLVDVAVDYAEIHDEKEACNAN